MMIDLDSLTVGELRELGRIAQETCGLEMTACAGGKSVKLTAEEVNHARN